MLFCDPRFKNVPRLASLGAKDIQKHLNAEQRLKKGIFSDRKILVTLTNML